MIAALFVMALVMGAAIGFVVGVRSDGAHRAAGAQRVSMPTVRQLPSASRPRSTHRMAS